MKKDMIPMAVLEQRLRKRGTDAADRRERAFVGTHELPEVKS